MYKYKVASKEAEYNKIVFKSILESEWAQFFDIMGWKWKYEPFLLKGWLPDFVLSLNDLEIIVEVKPIVPQKENSKSSKLLFDAVEMDIKANIFDIKESISDYVLLLGSEPIYSNGKIQLGWIYVNGKFEPFNIPYKSQTLIEWNKIAMAKNHAKRDGKKSKISRNFKTFEL